MGSEFERASAVERLADDSYRAHIDPRWMVSDKPNGGYAMAICARAAVDAVGENYPDPMATSTTYMGSPPAGEVRVDVEVLRRGGRVAVVRTRLSAAEPCLETVVTCGRLPDDEPLYEREPPPELPPEDDCILLPVDAPSIKVPINAVMNQRMDPAVMGWAFNEPTGNGEIRGYLSLADGTDFDPFSLLVAADVLPPASFNLGFASGWVPTMQLSSYVRTRPAPGSVRARLRVRTANRDSMDETCEVWDSRGHVVAISHQVAGLRLPDPSPGA